MPAKRGSGRACSRRWRPDPVRCDCLPRAGCAPRCPDTTAGQSNRPAVRPPRCAIAGPARTGSRVGHRRVRRCAAGRPRRRSARPHDAPVLAAPRRAGRVRARRSRRAGVGCPGHRQRRSWWCWSRRCSRIRSAVRLPGWNTRLSLPPLPARRVRQGWCGRARRDGNTRPPVLLLTCPGTDVRRVARREYDRM